MQIFIDESGTFVRPPAGKRNLSCVGALVVPDSKAVELNGRFDLLKRQWGLGSGEVKGSSLHEPQIAAVIEILVRCDCLFFVTATEMSVNDDAGIQTYQTTQAQLLTADLPASAHPELIRQLTSLRNTFEHMAPQLFLQAVLLTDLVKKVIDIATLHFAMTFPSEAGAFRWVIDGKDTTKTKYESAWELIAGGLVQSRNLESPGVMVEEGDYSHFQRFLTPSQQWPKHLPPPNSRNPAKSGAILNLDRILYESLTFADSKIEGGLQLADIATNTFRRAMMGRLLPAGYHRLGELMVRVDRSPFELHLFTSGPLPPTLDDYTDPHTLMKSCSRFAGQQARQ